MACLDDWAVLLGNEIIRVAADDYLQIKCGRVIAGTDLHMILWFFHSDLFALITKLDPEKLIEMLDEELRSAKYNYRTILKERTKRRRLWECSYPREKQVF